MTDTSFDLGLQLRREVMGDPRVQKSLEEATDFTRPLQELTTSFAWGEVWGREGHLDRRTRSLLTVAMLVALNRQAELQAHIVGAVRIGVSETEIREVIIHSAVYCGFPAALEATRSAQSALTSIAEGRS
ncbi:4-carboxymuconolactone decarboxylase [Rhizobium sp. SLBN-94]|nr:4-carboxymuconolactone decarboxylase [Rhizobium sp. SLBN-94]